MRVRFGAANLLATAANNIRPGVNTQLCVRPHSRKLEPAPDRPNMIEGAVEERADLRPHPDVGRQRRVEAEEGADGRHRFDRDHAVERPLRGAPFDIATGRCLAPPAHFKVRLEGGDIFVWAAD